jgi:hypothetical protein
MIDWKIQSRARACQACAKPFVEKQAYFTLLFDRKNNLERWDVCLACWEAQYGQGANDRKGFVSFWQGVFQEPPAGPPEPIQKESAESLLRKLAEQNDAQYNSTCFILAVMLERKRILKVKAQTTENGHRTLLYEHIRTGDLFSILDPSLQLGQLDEVQRTVTHLLEHGLNPAAAPVACGDATVQPAGVDATSTGQPAAPPDPSAAPVSAVETASPPAELDTVGDPALSEAEKETIGAVPNENGGLESPDAPAVSSETP